MMKASVEEVNSVQRRLTIELSEEAVKSAFQGMYQKLRKKARINGFRPGKAPLNVIKKLYGGSVAVDVADELIRQHLYTAIQDQSLAPISAPVIETSDLPSEEGPYVFKAVVDILPAIELDGYKGLKAEFIPTIVDDESISKELESFRERHSTVKELSEEGVTVELSHRVTVKQTATIDGEEFAPFALDNVPLQLGKDSLLKDLEDAIVGLKVGEEKAYSTKVPEGFGNDDLVGKTIDCVCTVVAIAEVQLPELDDELAKDAGFDSLDALKSEIKTKQDNQADQSKRNQLEQSLLGQIAEKHDFEVPPSMVDQVIDSIFDDHQFPSQEERDKAKADPEQRKQVIDMAKLRSKNTLLLSEVIKKESIEVTESDLDEHFANIRKNLKGITDEVFDNWVKSMTDRVKEELLFKKALDLIIENAEISEKQAK